MSIGQERGKRLVGYLQSRKSNRGMLAELRRGINPDHRHRGAPYLGSVGMVGDQAAEVVAALFAHHPSHQPGARWELQLHKLHIQQSPNSDNQSPLSRRFLRLQSCQDVDNLSKLMLAVFNFFDRSGLPVDYIQLYHDLYAWKYDARRIQMRWGRGFWNGSYDKKEVAEPSTANPSTAA